MFAETAMENACLTEGEDGLTDKKNGRLLGDAR